jgi:hypothetical protein
MKARNPKIKEVKPMCPKWAWEIIYADKASSLSEECAIHVQGCEGCRNELEEAIDRWSSQPRILSISLKWVMPRVSRALFGERFELSCKEWYVTLALSSGNFRDLPLRFMVHLIGCKACRASFFFDRDRNDVRAEYKRGCIREL